MRASHLRKRIFQNDPQAEVSPSPVTPLQTSQFPAFALIISHDVNEALHHRIHAALSSVSDDVSFPSFQVALANLQHMESYFEDSLTVSTTFLSSCRKLLPEIHDGASGPVRVFLGHHLLRSFLYLQNETSPGLEQLDALHLRQRQLMKRLTWDQWLTGVISFLSLYEQPRSSLDKAIQSLTHFAKTMIQMRMPFPEQARSNISPTELNRRFGRAVAETWKVFCQPHDWKAFDGLPLKAQEQPLNLKRFATHSHELPFLSGSPAISLLQFIPTLLESVPLMLQKLADDQSTRHFGIKELELSVSFGSGHQITKQIFLHHGIFDWDSATAATIEQIFESIFLSPSLGEDPPSDNTSHFFAHWQTQKGRCHDHLESNWVAVSTPDGPALSHSLEPQVAYLLSHIEHFEINPLRLCAKPHSLASKQLFMDAPSQLALEDISKMRRDLLAHYGQQSEHFFTLVSFRRPCASRSLFSPLSQPPSNLFSHAFQIRPPAVLRRPLPFFPEKELNRKQLSFFQENLFLLETIGQYACYALIFPEENYALWLCSTSDPEFEPSASSSFSCLGFFDSLGLLPNWLIHAPHGSSSA